ncbi:GntR family transcriptional regulator [Ferviditalea candida]|uniref:GntR family transcriptional regulator n=1 Tax=Ferviditalea candida TaxID=3108399 RepID=A0ABU5ZFI8_9BACL|nr:GntR family transcriptional regulator [Paenibacillaceae bacterium T2]
MAIDSTEQNLWVEEDLVPIRDKVYNYLKNAILNGEYGSGERLIERELADKLKISRTPIREALFRLESQGLVKTVPRKGVIVSEISFEMVMEVFTILSALQVLAVKLAIQKLNADSLQAFSKLIEKIEAFLDGQPADASIMHMEIYDTLFKTANSPKLSEIIQGLQEYIRAFANTGYEIPGRMKESMKEHLEVLQAVQRKETELAEYLTKIHLEKSRRAYMEVMEEALAEQNKNGAQEAEDSK